jgi:single-strand DNA-binding protein
MEKVKRKQHLLSLPNKSKKIKQEFNNVKIENHEHHRKTDKGCGSTHNVTGQTSSKLFSSDKRQLQKQAGRTHRANHLFRLLLLDNSQRSQTTDKRHFGRTHRQVSTRAWTGNDGEPKAGLNFHTSQIKLHGGSRKTETVQATNNNKGKVTAEQTKDDLPF